MTTVIPPYWEPLRYEPRQLNPDGRGRILWVVVDHHNSSEPVSQVDLDGAVDVIHFPTEDSAQGWIDRVKYMTERPSRARRV